MDRLICGDVGFGKTEIAVRAAFKAVADGKQVAILVPTTILALQHFKTFGQRLDEFGVTVDYLNRFRTSREKRIIFEKLEQQSTTEQTKEVVCNKGRLDLPRNAMMPVMEITGAGRDGR